MVHGMQEPTTDTMDYAELTAGYQGLIRSLFPQAETDISMALVEAATASSEPRTLDHRVYMATVALWDRLTRELMESL